MKMSDSDPKKKSDRNQAEGKEKKFRAEKKTCRTAGKEEEQWTEVVSPLDAADLRPCRDSFH